MTDRDSFGNILFGRPVFQTPSVPLKLGFFGSSPKNEPIWSGPPKIVISWSDYSKLKCYADIAGSEMIGFARAIQEGQKSPVIRLTDFGIGDSLVNGVHAELTPLAAYQYQSRWLKARNPLEAAKAKQMRCWWHSHASLGIGCNWSGEDRWQQENIFPGVPWMISLLTTHAGELRACFDMFWPFRMTIDSCPVTVEPRKTGERRKWKPSDILPQVRRLVHGFSARNKMKSHRPRVALSR